MKMFFKSSAAVILLGAITMAGPATAQKKDKKQPAAATSAPATSTGRVFATAGLEQAVLATNAYRGAAEQIKVTYKTQLDARDSRGRVLQSELQAMKVNLEELSKKPGATEKSLQPQIAAFQEKNTAAQRELGQMSQQVELALAYVREQISLSEDAAVRNAMRKSGVDVLINPEAIIFATNPSIDLTRQIVDEYNLVVGNIQITPPTGYQPGQLLQARAQQEAAAAQAAQGAPATAPKPAAQPDGR